MEDKLYICMRTDLGMSVGKMIAQAAHAIARLDPYEGYAAIVVEAKSITELQRFWEQAGDRAVYVTDAGKTEIEPTTTCAAAISCHLSDWPLLKMEARHND